MCKVCFLLILAIMVSGCMPSIFTAVTASTVAIAGDRSASQAIDDTTIATKVKTALIAQGFKKLYTKIAVNVLHGRVLYTGTVNTDEEILTVIKIAWDVDGVQEVVSELSVNKYSDNFNLVQYTKDSLITTQIQSKAFMDRRIKLVNYTIVTTNNIVYLFGNARSTEELEELAQIASVVNGVEKVVSHVKIRE